MGRWSKNAALLGVLVSLASAGCGQARAEAERPAAAPPVLVEAAPLARGPIDHPVRATGVVRAKTELDLSFKVGGVLAAVRADRGALVRKGQVLAALDGTEIVAGVRQAEEAAKRAKRDAERARRLEATGAVAVGVAEDAATAEASAQAALTAARFNAAHATLIAPEDGFIDARLAEAGEVIAPGRPVFRLSSRASGWVVRAGVVDRDAIAIVPGAAAEVTLDGVSAAPLAGVVERIAPAATPGTGTFEIEVRVDPKDAVVLRTGLVARVAVARRIADVVEVPAQAVVDASGHSGALFALDGDRARRVPVEIAFLTPRGAAVRGPLDGVSTVVTAGAHALVDGAIVRASKVAERSAP
jgi:RND family efflux transporter MFP subunit